MIFASTELAARIEAAECRILRDAAESVQRRRPEADVYLEAIGGGFAAYTGPGSPLNKLAGLGFESPVDEAALEPVEQAFADRKAPLQVEVSSLADPSVLRMLSRRGYVLQGMENLLGRSLSRDIDVPELEGYSIDVSPADELDLWIDVLVTGFTAPDTQGVVSHESFPRDELERTMRDLVEIEGFVRYLVRHADSGETAGGGSMRVLDGLAQLCGAATLPDHRRRGIQTALLARRLADLSRGDCDLAVVTTSPGSKSQENVQRRGFELLYTRAVLVRER